MKAVLALLAHEVQEELREGELLATTMLLAAVLLAMVGLGFAQAPAVLHPLIVSVALWLCLAMVGVLTLTRLFDREREYQTLPMLLLVPVDARAIYFAKAMFVTPVLVLAALLLVPGLALLFPAARTLLAMPGQTFALVVLGLLAYAAVATLFAGGLVTVSGKNVWVFVVVFPLTLPILLILFVATRALLTDHPAFASYLQQLAALDALLLVTGALMFPAVLRAPTLSNRAHADKR